MNARSFTEVIHPVESISPLKKFKRQQSKQSHSELKIPKKEKSFDALLQATYNVTDESAFSYLTGCYSKDAQPVVGNVSSFNQTS